MPDLAAILHDNGVPGHHAAAILRRANRDDHRIDQILSDFTAIPPAVSAKIVSAVTGVDLLQDIDDFTGENITSCKPPSPSAVPIRIGGDTVIICEHPKSEAALSVRKYCLASDNAEPSFLIGDRFSRERLFRLYNDESAIFAELNETLQNCAAEVERSEESQQTESLMKRCISGVLAAAAAVNASDIQLLQTNFYGQVQMKIDGTGHIVAEMKPHLYSRMMRVLLETLGVNNDTLKSKSTEAAITKFDGLDQSILEMYNFRCQFTMPEKDGSSYTVATIRLLARNTQMVDFRQAGFSDGQIKRLNATANSIAGLVLAIGPVNSGKSTTLYTLMLQIDPVRNLVKTIENPIEFRTPQWEQNNLGVAETEQEELSLYRDQIKGMVRKSPNCLLAGELRSASETKQIFGLAYASTLCFASIHAENCGNAVGRLLHWDIPPIDIGAVIRLLISQRLVRRLCANCKVEDKNPDNIAEFKVFTGSNSGGEDKTVFTASIDGCPQCRFTGYSGRKMIAEMLSSANSGFRDALEKKDPIRAVDSLLFQQGASLWHAGMNLVEQGTVSIEEVIAHTGTRQEGGI